ncbi:MAG TPA: aspartate aminotransferase family protein [Gaiellaceae bacterium]|nr:aspartate aminotransferase family protein [Gaiellaceae bacterium]
MSQLSVRELLARHSGDELELHARAANPQFVRMLRAIGFDRRWARAEGAHLYDADGNRYLDWLGGFGMYNVGRNNPRVRAALQEALELDTPGKLALGVNPLGAILADALLKRAPASLGRVLFTSSGTEAVEAAIKIGRAATGRTRVVSVERGFHGLTLGALSASGDPAFSERFGPLVPGFSRIPFDDLDALEGALRSEDVALFLVEPVVGHGVFLPSPGYLEGAQELCRRHGALFCLDEVQTGFGRTGRLFALEHWGLEPDIVTVAKSLSGGYVPVGAALFRASVFDAVFDSLEHSMSHGSTFQPNDLAMVAGLATLHELDSQRLAERSERLGELLLERTLPLVERYDVVKDVRGLGLMWAIELGEPEEAGRTTYRLLERMQPALFSQLVVVPLFTEHRVLSQVAGHGLNVIKGLPPLVLSEDDVDWFVTALDATLAGAEKMPRAAARFALRAARATVRR